MKQKWQPMSDMPPFDHWPVAVACRLTSKCGFSGIIIQIAHRVKGRWQFPPCDHNFDALEFMVLEQPVAARAH